MSTNVRTLPKEKVHIDQKPKSTFAQKVTKHMELTFALLSGAIILTAWATSSVIPHSVWVALHIVAFVIGGYAQGKEGILDTIENKELNVELLMVIAAIGAAAIGYWTEGAILIFIFALAGALETYTFNKSRKEISELMKLQPEEARIIRNEKEMFIPVSDLKIDDVIFVKASERIPADGMIVKGNTSIDESAITGESIPVTKQLEDEVFAGTVALDGSISIKITKHADETIFQRIINMIQSAKDEKPPTQLFIEKFEGTYVQIVLITVLIMMFLPYFLFGWTFTESIYRAMILLVVASPCALVASIMPATLSTISTSAKDGVLFKGGVHAEMISQVRAIAFDKTGTLTYGTPVVTDVHIHPDYHKSLIHEVVGRIESESMHPLAKAIHHHSLKTLNIKNYDIALQEVKTINGKGIIGMIDDEAWYIGKKELGSGNGHYFEQITNELADEGKTVVYVTHKDRIVAIYALKDTVRKEAKETIQRLKEQGIYTMMLTGDNERTAKAVATEVGIDDYVAECLPDKKVDQIKHLLKKHEKVAMVGDGINDAPALATANIGIAMGEGTDVALETADMVLMKNNLTKITLAIKHSKKMNRIIKQNIIFSLFVIFMLILSNFLQVIDMPLGVIGHEGSTILVILNGLRLLKKTDMETEGKVKVA